MRSLNTKPIGVLSAALGLAAIAVALLSTQFRYLGILAGIGFFLVSATIFSKANQIAKSLAPWVNRSVRVEVWGQPLPDSGEEVFEIDSISALSAGLLIYLHAVSGSPKTLLKVAQPKAARMEEGRIEIAEAAYVSWGGKRLKPAVGTKMPALVMFIA